ncbi:cytochrome P450 [Cyathus striatus]|nr:cytochrome P450 [Cyathus striatus]
MNSIDLLVLVSCISLLFYVYIRKTYTLPLPPGPSGYPLIRNLLDIPATFQWEAFAEWSKAHGSDVVFAEAIGVRFISLGSVRAAEDLLTKRSTIYSSRYSKSMGWGFQFATMPYGEKWRERRRLFQKHFPTGRHDNYRPLLKHLIRILQLGLIEQPETFYERIQHSKLQNTSMSGAFALVLGYGIKIQPINDPLVEFSKQTLGEGLRAGTPGRYLVDVIPALKYVPEWMPGAGFKRVAKMWYGLAQEFRNRPFEKGMDALAAGSSLTRSFLSMCISELPDSKDEQQELEAIKDAASMFYTGGSDTSVASMYVFVLAMTLFPEVQRKARNEIDEKIGGDRLPDFDDEPNLPYLTAVILEVLRDDIYKGYRMPKQSMVVANTWAMAHDETDYPDPYNFNPDRFMKNGQIDPDVRDPRTFSFGICPGLHIGWSTVWYTAANLISTFEILKPLNDRGEETEPEIVYESGIVSPPLKFDCRFKPRSATREQVIRAESNKTSLY